MKRSKVIELVLAAVVLLVVCVLVSLHAQDKKDVPQLKDKPAAELAKAALPLVSQLGGIQTQEALIQQAFIAQEQAKAKVNADLESRITTALSESGIDPTKYTVDLSTMLVQEKPAVPKPPTPATPPAKP